MTQITDTLPLRRSALLPLALLFIACIGMLPGMSPAHAQRLPHALQAAASERDLWLPPLDSPLHVSAPYDLSRGPYAAGHRGIDLPTPEGKAVVSPAGGTITFSGTVVDRPVISVRVDERTVVSLEPMHSELRPGDTVARGQPLGLVSTGGHCAAVCLHLGVRVDDAYVNPMRFFKGKPVLLPW